MFIEELNVISLGKLFQMVTARYKKLPWPVAVLQCGMSSLFSLQVERPLIVPLLMNLELRSSGAIPFMHLSLSKSGPRNFGTKNNFPSFSVGKTVWHIYIKKCFFSSFLFLLCYEPKLHFGRLRLLTVIRKVKFTDFVKRATSPKLQLTEFRFHSDSKVHSLLWLTKYGNYLQNSKLTREARRHPTLRPLFTY